jgi:hypothetical protein
LDEELDATVTYFDTSDESYTLPLLLKFVECSANYWETDLENLNEVLIVDYHAYFQEFDREKKLPYTTVVSSIMDIPMDEGMNSSFGRGGGTLDINDLGVQYIFVSGGLKLLRTMGLVNSMFWMGGGGFGESILTTRHFIKAGIDPMKIAGCEYTGDKAVVGNAFRMLKLEESMDLSSLFCALQFDGKDFPFDKVDLSKTVLYSTAVLDPYQIVYFMVQCVKYGMSYFLLSSRWVYLPGSPLRKLMIDLPQFEAAFGNKKIALKRSTSSETFVMQLFFLPENKRESLLRYLHYIRINFK